MGWRSQEQTQQLKSKAPAGMKGARESSSKPRRGYAPGEIPDNLPDRFFNEEGEVDLRNVKGRDAVQYLAAIGIHVPVGGGVTRGG